MMYLVASIIINIECVGVSIAVERSSVTGDIGQGIADNDRVAREEDDRRPVLLDCFFGRILRRL